MSRRQLGVVVAALLGIVAITVLAAVISSGASERELRGVSELSKNLIDQVILSDKISEATLLKEDGRWMVGNYPVTAWLLDALWETAERIDGADLIATNPENHPLMGVTPSTGSLVQFWSGGQLVGEFIISDREFARPSPEAEIISPWTAAASLCFIRRPDANEVYGVYCAEPDRFLPVASWWADPVITQLIPQDIQSITFSYPESSYRLNKVSGIEWRLDDGEQEANLTKTVDLIERFRVLVADAYPPGEEAATIDFSRPDASVSLVIEEQETAAVRNIELLFVRRDSAFYHIKVAATTWSYLLNVTSTETILQPRDWFLSSILRRSTSTAP